MRRPHGASWGGAWKTMKNLGVVEVATLADTGHSWALGRIVRFSPRASHTGLFQYHPILGNWAVSGQPMG